MTPDSLPISTKNEGDGNADPVHQKPTQAKPCNGKGVRTPKYRLHRPTGQAVVTLNGRDIYLGKHGTKQSKDAYRQKIAEWSAGGGQLPDVKAAITVAKVIKLFWEHARKHYCHADGTPTNEIEQIRYALRPLNHLYGTLPASQFSPLKYKAVRQLMIEGYKHPRYGDQSPLSRGVVNQRMARVKHVFKWGVGEEIVPASVHHGLLAVRGLQRGRTEAYEAPGVQPVARVVVEDTLPILWPTLADMVILQAETGMRPGELVQMRPCDIDMTGATWLYQPPQHKTQHHGHKRTIAIGPKAQEIIRRHLGTDTQAPLFRPIKVMEERAVTLRLHRKTKVQPSQQNRKKSNPKKLPGMQYTTNSYGRAIADAIKRHNKDKPEAEHIPHWHPNQLRHLRALELKRQFGLDVARAVLGHSKPIMTEHYAGIDVATAAEVMGKVG
jgi:integrase